MPLSASFILFDFIVHNPYHPETKRNVALLGVAAGYFCRLEYASYGSIPSSPFSEFVGIADQYIRDLEAAATHGATGVEPAEPSSTAIPAHNAGCSPLSDSVNAPNMIIRRPAM